MGAADGVPEQRRPEEDDDDGQRSSSPDLAWNPPCHPPLRHGDGAAAARQRRGPIDGRVSTGQILLSGGASLIASMDTSHQLACVPAGTIIMMKIDEILSASVCVWSDLKIIASVVVLRVRLRAYC